MKDSNNTAEVGAMAFFRDSWGGLLSTRPFKIFLLHVYLAYLAFAVWGCVNVKEGITLDRLAGDGSYVADYYDQDIKYLREYGPVVNVLIHKEIDSWSKTELDEIDNLLTKFEDTKYFHGKDITSAWTRDFTAFVSSNFEDSRNFSLMLDYFLSSYNQHNIDIVRDSSGKVKYSRLFVYSKDMITSVRESSMMSTAREIADSHPNLKVTVFHPAFIFYDQYLAVWPNTRQNLLIATAAMFVVSLLLIPHPVCSLWVTFSIVSICTGVIGYMTWWGVNLDTISMINIIICIGFCVDFSAHITYAYVLAEGDTGNERMRNALHAIGFPIVQGALSTIIGVFALAFSASYIFRTFFKTMFLVISLSAFHGLLIIPALLSIMGPPKINKKGHYVSPMNAPIRPSVVGGVDGLPPRNDESGYQNDWPGENINMESLSGRGRPQDKYIRPHEYVPPVNDTGRPRDHTGTHNYWPAMTNTGGPRDNYAGPDEYRPPMTNMGGPERCERYDIYAGP